MSRTEEYIAVDNHHNNMSDEVEDGSDEKKPRSLVAMSFA